MEILSKSKYWKAFIVINLVHFYVKNMQLWYIRPFHSSCTQINIIYTQRLERYIENLEIVVFNIPSVVFPPF